MEMAHTWASLTSHIRLVTGEHQKRRKLDPGESFTLSIRSLARSRLGQLNIGRRPSPEYHLAMSIDEIESTVLKLAAADRARLAERLLESLEQLSDEENASLWAEEAIRRDNGARICQPDGPPAM